MTTTDQARTNRMNRIMELEALSTKLEESAEYGSNELDMALQSIQAELEALYDEEIQYYYEQDQSSTFFDDFGDDLLDDHPF